MKYSDLHLVIYHKLKEKANGRIVIQTCDVLEVMKRNLNHVPLLLHYRILEELEEIQLIKKRNKMQYILIGGNADNKVRKYFQPYSR